MAFALKYYKQKQNETGNKNKFRSEGISPGKLRKIKTTKF